MQSEAREEELCSRPSQQTRNTKAEQRQGQRVGQIEQALPAGTKIFVRPDLRLGETPPESRDQIEPDDGQIRYDGSRQNRARAASPAVTPQEGQIQYGVAGRVHRLESVAQARATSPSVCAVMR